MSLALSGRPARHWTASAATIAWVDRLPAGVWLVLPVIALMPVWVWCAARLLDRSDDPLGIVALAALALLIARDRRHFCDRPRASWLVLGALLAAVAIVGTGMLPPLARGVGAVLAVCAVLFALRAPGQPMAALTGLALLALPLLSSLQFFVGYPLRVVTAEASRLFLSAFGVSVERDGTALAIAGRLVMVDAPCSGIQMGWVAYFTACVAAAWWRVPDGNFLRRVPLVGVAVLIGNIVRNTLLVLKESGLAQWPAWTHDAIGIAAFAVVCAFVLWHVAGAAHHSRSPVYIWKLRNAPLPALTVAQTWGRLFALALFTLVALWPLFRPEPAAAKPSASMIEWPRELDGQPLRPLALSAVEQRFADRFPGAIARFTDGERNIVLRHVTAPTRMLHPATDCYRGVGYRVVTQSLERKTSDTTLTRCFIAEKAGQRLRVCENIVDSNGQTFTDTSTWYWAAITGRSHGPWRAVTRAVAL